MPPPSSQAKGKALVLRSTVICQVNPLLPAYCVLPSASPLTLGPSVSVSLLLSAVKSADLGCGAGSNLVTLGRSLCFPTIRFFGSFLLSVVLWGSADCTSPRAHLPSPRTPPPPPFPAPTPGPALLSSPAPTSPLVPLPGLLAATSPRCCAFRENQ